MEIEFSNQLTPNHHATLFAYIVKSALDTIGDDCIQTLKMGVKRYGNQRGGRIAQRVLIDGRKLDLLNYFAYGEWEASPGEMIINFPVLSPDTRMIVNKCPWHDEWNKEGLMEYGTFYCDFVDKALLEGYNTKLYFELMKHRVNGGEYCDFHFSEGNLSTEDMEGISRLKELLGKTTKKDWDYHIGHIYKTLKEELVKDFGRLGRQAIENALDMYIRKYGQEVFENLLKFDNTNFDEVDDYISVLKSD